MLRSRYDPTLLIVRPAKRIGGWAQLGHLKTKSDRLMSEILDDLREDRA